MNIKKGLLLIMIGILFNACLNLDDNLFNSSKLTSYELENYAGEVDFKLPPQYQIDPSRIHIFPLQSGGTTIYALYIGEISKIATDTVIFYNHGNKDHMDFYWPRAQLLANAGGKNNFGVLMYDYRGYGMSEGESTEASMYEDARTALQWLQEKGLTGDRLIMYGFSMGTAPATELTANPAEGQLVPAKLILQAPYASTDVMSQDATAMNVPGSFVTNVKVNNAEEIKKVEQPLLWLHGVEDDFLSIETHGEVVFKNYSGAEGVAVRVGGAGHSNIIPVLGYENYLNLLTDFIR